MAIPDVVVLGQPGSTMLQKRLRLVRIPLSVALRTILPRGRELPAASAAALGVPPGTACVDFTGDSTHELLGLAVKVSHPSFAVVPEAGLIPDHVPPPREG